MCIIAIKNNENCSDKEWAEWMINMEKRNSDGNGIAIMQHSGRVYWKKGISLIEMAAMLERNRKTAKHIIMHFRISTGGQINKEMCHPFLVSDKRENQTEGVLKKGEVLLFHNGVFSGISPTDELSDTAMVALQLKEFSKVYSEIPQKLVDTAAMFSPASKFVVINSDGVLARTLNFQEEKENYFSNFTYENWSSSCYTGNGYGYSGGSLMDKNDSDDSLKDGKNSITSTEEIEDKKYTEDIDEQIQLMSGSDMHPMNKDDGLGIIDEETPDDPYDTSPLMGGRGIAVKGIGAKHSALIEESTNYFARKAMSFGRKYLTKRAS